VAFDPPIMKKQPHPSCDSRKAFSMSAVRIREA
jgi:hypothetical protein